MEILQMKLFMVYTVSRCLNSLYLTAAKVIEKTSQVLLIIAIVVAIIIIKKNVETPTL